MQVTELRQDLKDVEPKIEAIGESTVKKRDKIKELGETKSKMSDDFGYQDEQLKELRTEVEELKARTDSELNQLREDMQGVKKFISIYLLTYMRVFLFSLDTTFLGGDVAHT